MNCARARSRLSDYSAGLLDPRARAQVGDHLAACEECRLVHRQFVAVDTLARGEALAADVTLVQAAMARARAEEARRVRGLATLGAAGRYAAITLALAFISLLAWRAIGVLGAGAAAVPGTPSPEGHTLLVVAMVGIGVATGWLANRVSDLLA